MSLVKENFLRTRLVGYLQQLDPATPPLWGKMSVQHMIEHLAREGFAVANGNNPFEKIITPPERLEKMREFLMSDRLFRENTRNPLLPANPQPLEHATIQAAIGTLQAELIRFFEVYEGRPGLKLRNPIFGDLDFEQQVQLLFKHALHHLRQFGIAPLFV